MNAVTPEGPSNAPRPRTAEEALEVFLAARRRGELVDPAHFAAEHAHLGPELALALESLATLERARPANAPYDPALTPRIGPFRIVREVGRGGMGVVLEAVEEPLGRRVALKVLARELVASPAARGRFRREAELAARLDHPGIATVFGAGVDGDHSWIAMRFVEGEPLSRAIARARDEGHSCARIPHRHGTERAAATSAASVSSVARCLASVARALHAAHERGVVHRDVKPSNVVLGPDGAPTIVDFGLAIPEDSSGHTLSHTGEHAGTPAYMAPELLSGELERSDAACDVYSLGVTAYECLALRRPFDGATPFALQRAVTSSAPDELRALNRSVSRDLALVVATAMQRDRTRRYRDAAAFARDLDAAADGAPVEARPVPVTGRVVRWARREPVQASFATLVFVSTVVAAVAVGSWWNGRATVRAAELVRENEALQAQLAEGYFRLGRHQTAEAERAFADVLARRPADDEARVGLALTALKQDRADRAREVLAGRSSPAFDALRALAEGRRPAGDLGPTWWANASALELFVDGLRIVRQRERAPLSSAKELGTLAYERFDEAISRSETARFYHHVSRTQAAYWTGDERSIRSSAAALLSLWPTEPRALFTAGYALSRVDRPESTRLLERAIELDPAWGPPHQVLANEYYRRRDLEAALEHTELALRADPRDADAWNSLAMIQQRRGCMDEAREAALRAVCVRPGMFQAWGQLAYMGAATTMPEPEVETFFRGALLADPWQHDVRLEWGSVLMDWKRHAEAAVEFETVLGHVPGNVKAWLCAAANGFNTQRYDDAQAYVEGGLELDPKEATLLDLRERIAQRVAQKTPLKSAETTSEK